MALLDRQRSVRPLPLLHGRLSFASSQAAIRLGRHTRGFPTVQRLARGWGGRGNADVALPESKFEI